MDGGSLNTAYVSISEYPSQIRLVLLSTVCCSGQLPLEESSRLLEQRDICLCHWNPGETPLVYAA